MSYTSQSQTQIRNPSAVCRSFYRDLYTLRNNLLLNLLLNSLGWLFAFVSFGKYKLTATRHLAVLFVSLEREKQVRDYLADVKRGNGPHYTISRGFGGGEIDWGQLANRETLVTSCLGQLGSYRKERFKSLAYLLGRGAKLSLVHRFVGENWAQFSQEDKKDYFQLFFQAGQFDFAAHYLTKGEGVSNWHRLNDFALFLAQFDADKIWKITQGIDYVFIAWQEKGQRTITPGSLLTTMIDLTPSRLKTALFWKYCQYQREARSAVLVDRYH